MNFFELLLKKGTFTSYGCLRMKRKGPYFWSKGPKIFFLFYGRWNVDSILFSAFCRIVIVKNDFDYIRRGPQLKAPPHEFW